MTEQLTRDSRPASGYQNVPPQIDLPAMEHEILALWQRNRTFDRSLEQTADGEPWTFYEGPPTANGKPGTHHIETRVFKDVFPRFRTMRGFRVDRKAGWDCHGLPVELAVETELGLNGKPDIERYGVEAFNAKCRESVLRHVDAFVGLTERMGYWVNLDEAYQTMDPSYVESVWWALKKIFDAGLLSEDFRVAPYCPRCGTGLSDHELAQGYETIVDPSVYVRLPLTSGPHAGAADLLIWTTTPWTLPSNALVATKADLTYVVAAHDQQRSVVVAEGLMESVLGDGWRVEATFTGADMVGWTYDRPFTIVDWPGRGHFVVNEDYVTTTDGTGLVHQATVFGADDFESVRRNGVELINPINTQGRFLEGIDLVGGVYFRDANEALMADLEQRGLLFRRIDFEHSYPHCWRCHSALMYYALPSWYIRTTKIKDALLGRTSAPPGIRTRSSGAATATGSTTTSTGRCPAAATGARRCRSGATTPTRPRSSASGRWPSCRNWPAPTWAILIRTGLHRRRHLHRRARRHLPAGAGGDRRLVRFRLDALCPVGLPACRGLERTVRDGLSRPTSSARRSTRPAAGSTR